MDRNEHHVHLQVLVLEFLFRGEFLVELFLEQPGVLNRGAALYPLIAEIDGLAVDGQYADGSSLDHPIQITGPRFPHLREIDGESLASRLLWRRLLGERGAPGQKTTAGQAEHAGHEVWYPDGFHD